MPNIYEYVLRLDEPFEGHTYDVLRNGISMTKCGKARADYETEGYEILSEDAYMEKFDQFQDSLCNDWIEITEDEYESSLNVLPPMGWQNGGFFVPEAYIGNVYTFCQSINGKFYTSLQRTSSKRADIMENLKQYIDTINEYKQRLQSLSDMPMIGQLLDNAFMDHRVNKSMYNQIYECAVIHGWKPNEEE